MSQSDDGELFINRMRRTFQLRARSSNDAGMCNACTSRDARSPLVYEMELGPWTMRLCPLHLTGLKQVIPSASEMQVARRMIERKEFDK